MFSILLSRNAKSDKIVGKINKNKKEVIDEFFEKFNFVNIK